MLKVALFVVGSAVGALGYVAVAASVVELVTGFDWILIVPPAIVAVFAAVVAVFGAEDGVRRTDSMRWRTAGVVLAASTGSLALAVGWLVLVGVMVAAFFLDFGRYEVVALDAAIISIVGGTAAILGAGRASMRSEAGVWLELAVGIAALPLGWGVPVLASAFCFRRAASRRLPLPALASAFATAATGWTVVTCAILLHYGIVDWPCLAGACLGAAATWCLTRRPLLGAPLALAAGALWLVFATRPDLSLVNLAGIPYIIAALLAVASVARVSVARPRYAAATPA